ncbi:MAG: hypothetical protein WD225_04635, partial [Ilumatobacteraceae bacterium]
MSSRSLALYDLLSPYLLAGVSFPAHVDEYLGALVVRGLHTAADPDTIVYSGIVGFGVDNPARRPVHIDPAGMTIGWDDTLFEFRLTAPRDGTQLIADVVALDNPVDFSELDDLFADFGPSATAPTDYPGVGFRLELLVTTASIMLPPTWQPAAFDANRRLIVDPERAGDPVRFVLPKLVLVYEQSDDLDAPPTFAVRSWGHAGFDAPSDLAVGELVRMDPPFAMHESGRVAFGVDQVLVDLSPDHTPPEILAHFGTDEAFEGFYVKSARVSYVDESKDWALNVGVEDLLVSFAGEVTFEAEVDVLGAAASFELDIALYEGATRVEYQRGERDTSVAHRRFAGGQASIAPTGVIHVRLSGGTPPYAISVFVGDDGDTWSDATQTARVSGGAPGNLRDPGPAEMLITVTDATNQRIEEVATLQVRPSPTAVTAGAPADRAADSEPLPPATLTVIGTPPLELALGHTPAAFGSLERVTVGGPDGFVATVDGVAQSPGARDVLVDVPPGQTVPLQVTFPATPTPASSEFRLLFSIGRPTATESLAHYVANSPSPSDPAFAASRAPGQTGAGGAAGLQAWLATSGITSVDIDAHASYEPLDPQTDTQDQRLSVRRREVARLIVEAAGGVSVDGGTAQGHTVAAGRTPPESLASDRVAIVVGEAGAARPEVVIDATLSRPARPAPPATPPAADPEAAPPAPKPNEAPPIFRRISLRTRFERNVFVLGEISGELDFETQSEAALRNTAGQPPATDDTACIELRPPAADPTAPANPQDGVVQFLIRVTYDPATHELTEILQLGAHPDDRDGLLRWRRPSGEGICETLIDVAGAVGIFFPVLNAAAGA